MELDILRTRFKGDVVCEFLPPRKESNDVVILASGVPGYPGCSDLLRFISDRGYWAFLPRYRGSWESGGKFLRKPPTEDILDVVDELSKGFTDIWNGRTYKLEKPNVYIIGNSFGGAATLFASLDARVKKVALLSPSVDWKAELQRDLMDWLEKFMEDAFGEGYRFGVREWKKLKAGKFYNPATRIDEFNGKKILIFHARNDDIIFYDLVKTFAERTKSSFVTLKRDGHLFLSCVSRRKIWRTVERFFKAER